MPNCTYLYVIIHGKNNNLNKVNHNIPTNKSLVTGKTDNNAIIWREQLTDVCGRQHKPYYLGTLKSLFISMVHIIIIVIGFVFFFQWYTVIYYEL